MAQSKQEPFRDVAAIDVSSTDKAVVGCVGFYAAVAGTVAVTTVLGTTITIPVTAGSYHPIRVQTFKNSGTDLTSTNLFALFNQEASVT